MAYRIMYTLNTKYPNTGVILLAVKVFVTNSSILSLKMAT